MHCRRKPPKKRIIKKMSGFYGDPDSIGPCSSCGVEGGDFCCTKHGHFICLPCYHAGFCPDHYKSKVDYG